MVTAERMKAVCFRAFKGGASALEYTEIPVPGPPKKGEVLVKVEAIGLNPVDWKLQGGDYRPLFPSKLPYVTGIDVAGEVVQVGPEVKQLVAGQKVVCFLELKDGGGCAEYVVAKAKYVVRRPSVVSAETGASLPTAGMTAIQCIRNVAGASLDGSYKGNILVMAATGGVGVYAVQLAKLAGAHVTATCGARNLELVKGLGADDVLDYKTPQGERLESSSGRKYDVIIHGVGTRIPWATFRAVLAENGKVIDLTPSAGSFFLGLAQKATFAKQRVVNLIMDSQGSDLQALVDLAAHGKLKTLIDSRFPFPQVREAWERGIAGHATGKIVITVP